MTTFQICKINGSPIFFCEGMKGIIAVHRFFSAQMAGRATKKLSLLLLTLVTLTHVATSQVIRMSYKGRESEFRLSEWTDQDRETALREFLDWFKDNGGEFAPGVVVKSSSDSDGGVGIFWDPSLLPEGTTVHENDELFRIPQGMIMSQWTALNTDVGTVLASIMKQLTAQEFLALHLLIEAQSEYNLLKPDGSPWRPYIASLPRSFTNPLFWDEADLAVAGFPNVKLRVKAHKQALQESFEYIFTEGLCKEMPDAFPAKRFSLAGWFWAHSVVMSRSFTLSLSGADRRTPALVPVADMLNTDPSRRIHHVDGWIERPDHKVESRRVPEIGPPVSVYGDFVHRALVNLTEPTELLGAYEADRPAPNLFYLQFHGFTAYSTNLEDIVYNGTAEDLANPFDAVELRMDLRSLAPQVRSDMVTQFQDLALPTRWPLIVSPASGFDYSEGNIPLRLMGLVADASHPSGGEWKETQSAPSAETIEQVRSGFEGLTLTRHPLARSKHMKKTSNDMGSPPWWRKEIPEAHMKDNAAWGRDWLSYLGSWPTTDVGERIAEHFQGRDLILSAQDVREATGGNDHKRSRGVRSDEDTNQGWKMSDVAKELREWIQNQERTSQVDAGMVKIVIARLHRELHLSHEDSEEVKAQAMLASLREDLALLHPAEGEVGLAPNSRAAVSYRLATKQSLWVTLRSAQQTLKTLEGRD